MENDIINNGSTNTNSTQIDKENDIYANISFEEIVERINYIQDVPVVDEINYYLKEKTFEENEKKEVIEVCIQKEKNICDNIKSDIENKKIEIDEKQKDLLKRKEELPLKIEQEQKEVNDKVQDYTTLKNLLDGISKDSDKYNEIEQKLNDIKYDLDDKVKRRDNLQKEYGNINTEFEKLEDEKREYSKTVDLYNDRVDKINSKIDEIDFMNISDRPEKTDNIIQKDNINQQANIQDSLENNINSNNQQYEQGQLVNNTNINSPTNEEQSLVDPSKQNKIKQFFEKVKQKVKDIATKVRKNGNSREEKINETNEYIDRLKNTEIIFNDKDVQNEFLESLRAQVNVDVKEQAEQMKKEGRTIEKDEKTAKDMAQYEIVMG